MRQATILQGACLGQVCENVALVLTAYSTLLTWNLSSLMALIATQFGARGLSLVATYGLLQLR
jgi:hypothetical protein